MLSSYLTLRTRTIGSTNQVYLGDIGHLRTYVTYNNSYNRCLPIREGFNQSSTRRMELLQYKQIIDEVPITGLPKNILDQLRYYYKNVNHVKRHIYPENFLFESVTGGQYSPLNISARCPGGHFAEYQFNDGFPPRGGSYTNPNDVYLRPIDHMTNDVSLHVDRVPTTYEINRTIRAAFSDASLLGNAKTVQLANFIYELKDIKRLKELLNFNMSARQKAADSLLSVEFGILPFVRDLQKILDLVLNLRDKISKWNAMASKQKTMNIHRTIYSETNTSTAEVLAFRSTLYFNHKVTLHLSCTTTNKAVFSAYFVPFAVDTLAQLEIAVGLLGLDDPAAIAWEAMPYSFLIDWFINIGELIDNLEYDEPTLRTKVLSMGYSTLSESFCTCTPVYDGDGGSVTLKRMYDYKKSYKRTRLPVDYVPDIAIFDGLAFNSSLTANQAALSAALASQRIR